MTAEPRKLHGLLAVFDAAEPLVDAARRTRDRGYLNFDAFSPFPVEGLAEAMRLERTWVAPICWFGGFTGASLAFGWQWFDTRVTFPLNVGGRPIFSWPAYVPITFELMILFAGVSTFLGVIALNRLPQLYHPAFNIDEFQRRNSSDGFFLLIEARDPLFGADETHEFLRQLQALRIYEVPDEP